MITYSEYIQAKRIEKKTDKSFVRYMMLKTISEFKKQLRRENAYVKH